MGACAAYIWFVFGLRNTRVAYERGLAENARRTSIGLRLIQSNWICFRSYGGADEWLSKPDEKSAVKVVRRDSQGRITREEDRYFSGRSGAVEEAEGEILDEELVVSYDYERDEVEVVYIGPDRKLQAALERASTAALRWDLVARVKAQWGLRD